MTTTHSASSQNPDTDNVDINAAGPYGTRSRNRGPRINYADDKELDMEIEAAGRIGKGASRKAAAVAAASTPTGSGTNVSNGFSTINSVSIPNGELAAQNNTVNPNHAPAPAPSKKRKQPGGSATASGTTTPFAPGSRHQPAQSAHYVASNMMSFTKSGGRLNSKKQLVADDGTTLEADGELLTIIHLHTVLTTHRPYLPCL